LDAVLVRVLACDRAAWGFREEKGFSTHSVIARTVESFLIELLPVYEEMAKDVKRKVQRRYENLRRVI